MMCLLDTSADLSVCAEELGLPVGQLITPLTRFSNRGGKFAIVCNMRRTLELFRRWKAELKGWPLALAIQNGVDMFDLPWEEIDAVFIGGDDHFKTSKHSADVISTAKALSKWVHVGRVNTPERFAWCVEHGVGSIDGSGISQYSHQRRALTGKSVQAQIPLEAMA